MVVGLTLGLLDDGLTVRIVRAGVGELVLGTFDGLAFTVVDILLVGAVF